MGQRLFSVGKVGVFLDAVSLGKEKRKGGEEATVLRLACRIDPFTPELAGAIDEGLGGDTNVRASVFRTTDAAPKPHLERLDMSLDCPRQRVDLYASPDSEASRVCFDHVKVSGFYVRAQKDSAALTAIFSLAFGPFSAAELEAATMYFRSQMHCIFHEAEPSLAFDSDDDQPTDRAEADGEGEQPALDESLAVRENAARKPAARGGKARRHNPEGERVAQIAEGRKAKPVVN